MLQEVDDYLIYMSKSDVPLWQTIQVLSNMKPETSAVISDHRLKITIMLQSLLIGCNVCVICLLDSINLNKNKYIFAAFRHQSTG